MSEGKQPAALIDMETFQMESCVRGYHIYKELWEAVVGEELEYRQEHDNPSDTYAVALQYSTSAPKRVMQFFTVMNIIWTH